MVETQGICERTRLRVVAYSSLGTGKNHSDEMGLARRGENTRSSLFLEAHEQLRHHFLIIQFSC